MIRGIQIYHLVFIQIINIYQWDTEGPRTQTSEHEKIRVSSSSPSLFTGTRTRT
jgi:hypothetical protein